MKITRRQLRRIIREAKGSTKKYDDDSALRGGQSKLPDGLQKGIIDKTVEDREEHEEEERKEKNESVRITRRQLRRIIRETGMHLTGKGWKDPKPGEADSLWPRLGKGWQLSSGACDTHNISPNDAAEAMAVLQEFGYELGLPPAVDSNNMAINDALAAYPGEFSYEDFLCAIRVVQGRGG